MDIKKSIEDSINTKKRILSDNKILANIELAIDKISKCLESDNKLLVAGNGGSAADAQHFVAELVCRFKKERKGYAAISLNTNTSILTAWSNDYNYESIFSRQIEALGRKNDIFVGISTSGNSENIIQGVKRAGELGLMTICLLGNDGGKLKNKTDLSIAVPSNDTARIQESHIMIIHIICEGIEKSKVK